jgi:hypothetical protein
MNFMLINLLVEVAVLALNAVNLSLDQLVLKESIDLLDFSVLFVAARTLFSIFIERIF